MDEMMDILDRYRGKRGATIPILQDIQDRYGYISPEAVRAIDDVLGISENEVYGIATFYTQFRFEKPGDHIIKVCMGTACHVKGSERLSDLVSTTLGVETGRTSADGKFSTERVACLGACALAPVVVMDDQVHGKMDSKKLKNELNRLANEAEGEA